MNNNDMHPSAKNDQIEYCADAKLDPAQLQSLYIAVGWENEKLRSLDQCEMILRNNWQHISAHLDGEMVGFVSLLSDGVFGEVLDLMVSPRHRRHRIGTELMMRIMTAAAQDSLQVLHLIDGSGTPKIYERLGFQTADPKEEIVMYWDVSSLK